MSSLGRGLLAASIVLLVALAAFAAVQRTRDLLDFPSRAVLSPVAQEQLAQTAAIMGLEPGTAPYRELERRISETLPKFHDAPAATLLHMVPGTLLLVLALLQFSRRIRTRWPVVHRWNGRVLLAAVVAIAGSGLWFAVATPLGGLVELLAVVVFGGFFVWAALQGWMAIRRGRPALHRQWMIRMFGTALGISVIRVLQLAALALTDLAWDVLSPRGFGISLWIGWVLTLAFVELYLRAERLRSAASVWRLRRPDAQRHVDPLVEVARVNEAGRAEQQRDHSDQERIVHG